MLYLYYDDAESKLFIYNSLPSFFNGAHVAFWTGVLRIEVRRKRVDARTGVHGRTVVSFPSKDVIIMYNKPIK